MKRKLTIVVIATLLCTATAWTQNALIISTPEQQAKIKPLVEAETKAREALNGKIATLPEAKVYKDAEEALKKASGELNKAAERLPENAAWKAAGAAALDEAYRIQAEHKLSSREFHPELNPEGKLVFVRNGK